MTEEEITQHLIALPKDVREHLITVYGDAAALLDEVMRCAGSEPAADEVKRQQDLYVRLSTALLESLPQDSRDAHALRAEAQQY